MSIKKRIEMKKKAQKDEEEKLDPSITGDEEDNLDLSLADWDLKMTPLHCNINTFLLHNLISINRCSVLWMD